MNTRSPAIRRMTRGSTDAGAVGSLTMTMAMALAVLVGGCHDKARTEIVVGIATDLMAPAPLRQVHLQVTRVPQPFALGEQDFPISGSTDNLYELPGTYAVYSSNGTPDRVRILLKAFDDTNNLVVQRSAVLSLVPQKTLFVRMGVVSACVGKLDCPDGDTCIDGRCAPETIDSSRLPVYKPGMEGQVSCTGGVSYVDTSTKVRLPSTGSVCADHGTCQDGVCLGAVEGSFTTAKSAPHTVRTGGASQSGTGLMLLDNGQVLLVGGTGANATLVPFGAETSAGLQVDGANATPVLSAAETFDPATQTFTATGSLATPRVYFGEAKLSDGRVLIAGGINEGGAALATAEIYDPSTRTFSPAAGPMNVARTFPAMARLVDGRVLVVGGTNAIRSYSLGVVTYTAVLASAEIFDPVTRTFTLLDGGLAGARAFAHVTPLADGGVLVSCGGTVAGVAVAGLERFDPVRGTFTQVATLPGDATNCDSNVGELPDGRLLLTTEPGDVPWLYDPTARTFASAGSHPAIPRGTFAAVLRDGRALFAGSTAGQTASTQAYLFDPASRSFAFVQGQLAVPVSDLLGALLPNGDVLVAGAGVPTAEIFHPGRYAPPAEANGGTGGTAGRGAGGTAGRGTGGMAGRGAGGTAGRGTGGTAGRGAGGAVGAGGTAGLATSGTAGGGGALGGVGGVGGRTTIASGGAGGGGAAGAAGAGDKPGGTGGSMTGRAGAGGAAGGSGGAGGATSSNGGAPGAIVVNGDFSGGMSPWTTQVFATGSFTGFPKLTVQREPACLSDRLANPYFQLDVPGKADGAIEQMINLPITPTTLSLVVWGGADAVTFTVSLIDVASQEHELESFTPPPIQDPNGGCLASVAPIRKTYPLEAWNGPVTLRFRATSTGSNGTIASLDDIVVK